MADNSSPVPATSTKPVPPKNGTPRLWKRLLFWGLPAVAIAGAAVGGVKLAGSHRTTPVHYVTARATRADIGARVTANGTLSALVTVLVGSQVSGRIETLGADFGSPVKKGQLIATIEPSLFQAAANQARANQTAAQASVAKADSQVTQTARQYERAKRLFEEGITAQQDLELAESNHDVALADMKSASAAVAQTAAAREQAELNLKYTKIVSPIDGIVISRNVDVGQTVAATLQAPTLFTIAQDLTHMQVDTSIAESDVGKIRAGMKATFTVDAYPDRKFEGTVRQVRDAAITVQNVVTYDAVIDVDNPGLLLKPGMTASATFIYATSPNVLVLPNAALRFKADEATAAAMVNGPSPKPPTLAPDERSVWIVRDRKPLSIVVRIGLTDGTSTEVKSGDLRDGDEIVLEASLNGKSS